MDCHDSLHSEISVRLSFSRMFDAQKKQLEASLICPRTFFTPDKDAKGHLIKMVKLAVTMDDLTEDKLQRRHHLLNSAAAQ
ncbi:hypothetical protein RvY_13404 [Ramazzottius varieornatus]|uniref:Uncharacterized protein n=1 Tax=Ramazzottius varieornatus TaxID=947166 RepID=A0A1D1VT23_RAMVA|nr:hypothetical protein RvY_13404 [Ramazzottius varieornatus]